jgi:hypothetical protein
MKQHRSDQRLNGATRECSLTASWGPQRDQGWGKSVAQTLAVDLRSEFPGILGFSAKNLWHMKQFFLEYSNKPKLQPLVGEIR